MMHERDFEFLDLVVGMFAGTSKELIVKAASTENLGRYFLRIIVGGMYPGL